MHGSFTIQVGDQPTPVEVVLSESGQWSTGHHQTQRLLEDRFPAQGPKAVDDAFIKAAEHLKATKITPAGGHPFQPDWAKKDADAAAVAPAPAQPPPAAAPKHPRPANPPRPPRGREVADGG